MRKEQWINIRGLAILSVIIIHTTTMRFNSSSMLNNWINLFFDCQWRNKNAVLWRFKNVVFRR
ncbi:hypothetical protein AUF16_15255 [Enterococcus avium]|nr:hypothetical protein AUF16_15255 [Enterococcus avium]